MKKLVIFIYILLPFFTKAQIINTIAGTGVLGYGGDGGQATLARLHLPGKAIFDANGNLYIADSWGHRVRKVDAITKNISTIAGTGVAGFNGDNIQATTAQLYDPVGLAFDNSGNLYIGDCINQRIRKINLGTGIITTYAGNGFGAGTIGTYSGDGGIATNASLNGPAYIAFDQIGNLYIEDGKNYRIRKVNIMTDTITTFAGVGTWGFSGDGGQATSAEFNMIQGIIFDNNNNLFVVDTNSTVRKINTATGIITTVAGIHFTGYSGDGGPASVAEIASPFDIVFDAIGNYYIAEFKGRIRKVDTFGNIHTFAGTTIFGYNGDGIPATSAELNETTGVSVDLCGNLFIADGSNERIREIILDSPIITIPSISLSGTVSAYPGTSVTITATVANAGGSYLIEWMNHGLEFTTTTMPSVTYTKTSGIDTITAKVVSTATYGCYDSTISGGHVVDDGSTVLLSLSSKSGFAMYPNPAGNSLYLVSGKVITSIEIDNLFGLPIFTKTYKDSNVQIDISGLPTGIYAVKVNGIWVQKLIKE